jgi:hypothetical protein
MVGTLVRGVKVRMKMPEWREGPGHIYPSRETERTLSHTEEIMGSSKAGDGVKNRKQLKMTNK